jgi:hypothetical protein
MMQTPGFTAQASMYKSLSTYRMTHRWEQLHSARLQLDDRRDYGDDTGGSYLGASGGGTTAGGSDSGGTFVPNSTPAFFKAFGLAGDSESARPWWESDDWWGASGSDGANGHEPDFDSVAGCNRVCAALGRGAREACKSYDDPIDELYCGLLVRRGEDSCRDACWARYR